jgi:hypothetical protein
LLAVVAFACGAVSAPSPATAQAVEPIAFGTGPLAQVRLGIALAASAELADAPDLLARPSSQAFVDDAFAFAQGEVRDAALRAEGVRARAALAATAGAPFDRARADAEVARYTRTLLRELGAPDDRLCALGILAEQTAYDARVLRSPADDARLRKAVGASDIADGSVPGLAGMRARLAALPAGRWDAIASAAGDVTSALLGPGASPPFPASDAVWMVLLRSRPTNADAERRGTPHLWLDVVRFDGSHRSFGAYPGGGDFTRDAHRLACAAGREDDAGSEGAVPVPPPPGTTVAQLAATIAARCAADTSIAGEYRVRAASDARYVVDLLLAAGVDAGPLLRAR